MPETRKRPKDKPEQSEASQPDVIVDFIFDDGLFFISISNLSDKPAYKVSVKFDHKILGLGGKDISALPLFRNIEFLAPHKEIRTFLNNSGAYFSSGGPTKISARVAWQDFQGAKKVVTIDHDLGIYKEIGFIRRLKDGA